MKKLLVICGATASGKTALAVECAKRLGGEVVSCDALLVYRGLNIGTAKPTKEERAGIPPQKAARWSLTKRPEWQ